MVQLITLCWNWSDVMARSVRSTVTLNTPTINRLTAAAKTALSQVADVIQDEVRQDMVIPRDTGALQGEKFFVDNSDKEQGKVRLVHEGPYARRLYYHPEYHFSTAENPNAKGKWFEDYEPGGKKAAFVDKAYKQLYKREAGL